MKTTQDDLKDSKRLEQPGLAGDVAAACGLVDLYREREDWPGAFRWYRLSVDQLEDGDEAAQVSVALTFYQSSPSPDGRAEGDRVFEKLAHGGRP